MIKDWSTLTQSTDAESGDQTVDDVELSLFLDGLYLLFGYDFRGYNRTSIRRRISDIMENCGLRTISALQDRVFRDRAMSKRLLSSLSVHVSEFFRNPEFFSAFRHKAVPLLRTYPQIRIWHAGCATGEEVYSMTILLTEEDLLDKSMLYATDINAPTLNIAMHGTYAAQSVRRCEESYKQAGGKANLWNYFRREDDKAHIHDDLRAHTVFSQHNLVSDASFNEFNVILCRNVLIYFTKELRNKVHELLYGSLARFGLLGLGANESIQFTSVEKYYRPLDTSNNLYRRIG